MIHFTHYIACQSCGTELRFPIRLDENNIRRKAACTLCGAETTLEFTITIKGNLVYHEQPPFAYKVLRREVLLPEIKTKGHPTAGEIEKGFMDILEKVANTDTLFALQRMREIIDEKDRVPPKAKVKLYHAVSDLIRLMNAYRERLPRWEFHMRENMPPVALITHLDSDEPPYKVWTVSDCKDKTDRSAFEELLRGGTKCISMGKVVVERLT